jgi:3-oxoacyl-[acyl-carrier protein] reductase
VALITGAGRGIGRATALRLAHAGARVVVNDLDEAPAREVEREICSAGGECLVVLGSVTSPEVASRMASAAAEKWNRIDILVNNAGITRDAMIHRMSDEQFNTVMDVIVRGAFNCIRAVAPWMRDAARREQSAGSAPVHRKIVNISSITGIHGAVGNANYAAAKAAIIGLTKAVAREWAPFRVNCNAIAPGIIDTRMTASRESQGETGLGIPAAVRDRILAQMPFGRIGTPEDVAAAVEFFASPDSDFITGQVLEIHGGVEYINVVG